MCSRSATNVSVRDPGATPSSSRYPSASVPSRRPGAYCPSTMSSLPIGDTDRSTLIFSARIASAAMALGTSIATSASSWVRWLCTMSRMAPAFS